ncbi:C-C motif chemokine 25, partial [Carlito syrichta]|uniref:C-C motif chemokine 25 n=1 Tax=Carlito syrichta TaxID=1868482 RepID=A0A1U7T597_CARSF
MNPWLLACLVVCLVGAWAPTVHTQGAFEDCCLAYHRAGLAMLQHARCYRRQEVSGSCNLPAVIFYFPRRRRMVCGNPQAREVQNAMRHLDRRHKTSANLCHSAQKTFQGSHAGRKKLPLSKVSDPTGGSKRNASLFLRAAHP